MLLRAFFLSLSVNGSTVHWNKEVNRRCRKEGKCSLWSGRGSGGKDVQLSFFVHRKTKKGIQRTKSRHLPQIQRLQREPVPMVTKEEDEGGLRVLGGVQQPEQPEPRQMRDMSVCVCVCLSGCVYHPPEPCYFCASMFVHFPLTCY